MENNMGLIDNFLEQRNILLCGDIDTKLATIVRTQLLSFEADDAKLPITMYIDSVGGEFNAFMSIYDTMKYISCDVAVINCGLAASGAAFILAGGTKGMRYSLPHAEVMIHQPSIKASGKSVDFESYARHLAAEKEITEKIFAADTGKSIEKVSADMLGDNWFTAEQALEYGIIDEIIMEKRKN